MKADGSRLIPRKHTETPVLLSGTNVEIRKLANVLRQGISGHVEISDVIKRY